MYAQQKASSGTRSVGLVTTAAILAATAYVATTGLGARFIPAVEQPIVLEFIDAPEETVAEPPPPIEVPPEIEAAPVPPPTFVPPLFVPEEAPVVIAAPAEPQIIAPEGPPAPPRGSDRVAPQIRAGVEPPYPSASRRLQEQGVTGLEVCVNANGRVTSASLLSSSGHPRLDQAALQWIREARFTPGSVGGRAQPMCGHKVDYEWTLR